MNKGRTASRYLSLCKLKTTNKRILIQLLQAQPAFQHDVERANVDINNISVCYLINKSSLYFGNVHI